MNIQDERAIVRATEAAAAARADWERCFSKEFYERLDAVTSHAPAAKAMIANAKYAEYQKKCEELFNACYVHLILNRPVEDK